MQIQSLGYRTDLIVRRLAGSTVEKRSGYSVVRTPGNPGFYWGNFLLMPAAPSVNDVEQWESWFVAELPDARHRAYGLDTADGDTGDAAALAALGVSPQVNAVMSATTLCEPAMPDVDLRSFDGTDWPQLVALRATLFASDDDPAETLFVERQVAATAEQVAAGSGEWLGAFDEGRLVAALGIVTDGSGLARYQAVETHPDYRRRGIARRLVYDAAVLAAERFAARELVIVADRDYHALALYESLGFATVELQVELLRAPSS